MIDKIDVEKICGKPRRFEVRVDQDERTVKRRIDGGGGNADHAAKTVADKDGVCHLFGGNQFVDILSDAGDVIGIGIFRSA